MSTSQMTVRVKIVLIGDGMVGKTTLVKSFLKGTAISDTSYKRTVGADIFVKNDIYEFDSFGKVAFNWMIWDLAGQPTFKMVRGQYYKGAQAGIAVFDVSRPQTFKNLHYWIAEMFKHAGGPKPLIIVGNKIDLKRADVRKIEAGIENLKKRIDYHEDTIVTLSIIIQLMRIFKFQLLLGIVVCLL